MKLKRILASLMTAAMVITSVPVSGLGAITAQAAEGDLDAPSLTVTAPTVGGAIANANIASAITDAEESFSNSNSDSDSGLTLEEQDGSLEILSENGVENAFSGKIKVTGEGVNVTGTTPFLISFKMKPSTFSGTQCIIGKMDNQFGVQLDNAKLAFYTCCTNVDGENKWVEVGVTGLSDVNSWHDVVALYDGAKFNLWVKKPDGNVAEGTTTSTQKNENVSIVENTDNDFTIGYNSTYTDREYTDPLADVKMYTGEDVPTLSEGEGYNELVAALADKTAVLDIQAAPAVTANYTVGASAWTDADGNELTEETFADNQTYKVSATVTPAEGYQFTENSKDITKPEDADSVNAILNGDGTLTVTYTYTLGTPVTAPADLTEKTYEKPVLGEVLTEADKSLYTEMDGLTVNMVYKYNNPENKNYALFTLVGEDGNYLSVWSNPNINSTQGWLTYSFKGENVPIWSNAAYFINDSNYHKITLTINSGVTNNFMVIQDGTPASWGVSNNILTTYQVAYDWLKTFKVKSVLVGTAYEGSSAGGNRGDLVDLDGTVQYVTVTNEKYTSRTPLETMHNAVSDTLKTEFTALKTECADLNEEDYEEEGWTAFSTALDAANAVDTNTAKEWTLYTTLEALKTAKEALVTAEKDKEIANAALTLKAPATGMAPANAATADEGYTVSTTWKTADGTILDSSEVFEAETVYAAEIVLTAEDGYVFAENVAVTLNGDGATVVAGDGTLTVSQTFAKTSNKTAIAAPNLSLKAPTVGGTPEDAVDKDAVGTDSGFTLDDCITMDEKPNLAGNKPFVFTFDIDMTDVDNSTDARILGQKGASDSKAWQYNFGVKDGLISVYANASCLYDQNDQANDSAWPQADVNVSGITVEDYEDGWVPVIVMYTGADADDNVDNKTRLCLYVGDQGKMGRYSAFSIPEAGGEMSFNMGIPMRNFKLYTGEAAAAAATVVRNAQEISDNYTQVAATATKADVVKALENETPVLNLSTVEPKGNGYTLNTVWTKNVNDADTALKEAEKFTAADTYKATITLTPEAGMEFAEASKPDSIEIDGQKVALEEGAVTINDAGNMVITVSFPSIDSAQDALKDAITDDMVTAAATNNTANDRPIYTTSTWNDFKQAYDNAAALTGDNADLNGVSAADLAAAKAALEEAYAALEEADLGEQTNVAVYLPASALKGSADSVALEGEGTNGAADKAVDGDKDSYWHTNWKTATDDNPNATYANGQLTGNNNFYIELDKAYTVSGLRYLPRPSYDPTSGTINNGAILKCNIYVATQKDANDAWVWTRVSENEEWDPYPENQTDYTVFRRYAEFDAVDDVQAVRIEAINTAGPQPNMFVNAAEIDILAVDALYENENGEALTLLEEINEEDIQDVVTAGNENGRWSTESWNAFVEKYNDAVEVFRDLHDESVKNEDDSVNAAVFTTAAAEMRTAFEALEAPCLCTVTINSISVQDVTGNVLALGDDTSKEYTLVADVTVASNGCTHEGHTDEREATVTYRATGTGATLSGDKLTVANTATNVRITATATCDGITSEAKTAEYTVTSNKAKNDLSAKIDDAEKIEKGDKTDEAYAALQEAIEAAKAVLNKEDATDAERKAATTALANAITTFNNSSVPTPGDDTAKKELYDKLFELLNDSDAKTKSGLYTVESVNALVPVHNASAATFNKANVDGILHLENVTLDELQKAYDDLAAALPKLVTKEAQAAADLAAAKAEATKALADAKAIVDAGQGTYTDATWNAFKAAYDAAAAGLANGKTTAAQLKSLAAALTAAQKALVKGAAAAPVVQNGQKVELTSGRYQVIDAEKKTVRLLLANKKKEKANMGVAASIKINGVAYKVTEVGPKAFKGFKKLKKITLSKNITTIGKQAFYGCKKLSSVVVKGTVLKKFGAKAFKGTSKKMTVTFKSKKVKAAKRKALLKKMKKAGMSKAAKLK